MYIFIGYYYYQTYLLLLIILYSIIAGCYIYYLPFYSELLNFIKIFLNLDCVVIILAFLIGCMLNDSGIPLLVTIIMQLIIVTISYSALKYRISKIGMHHQHFYNKFAIFELSIRSFLKSDELGDNLLELMNKNFMLNRDKFNIVIQAYYCSDILFNQTLAYNKIIGIKYKGLDIFTNYQVYKCRKAIISLCKLSAAEGIQLYQYFADLEKLKIDDKNFCEQFTKFSYNIIESNPNLSNLKVSIVELIGSKKLLLNSYESILSTFPNSNEVNDMYGSLLINILSDNAKGELY